ncbi:elongation factor Ts, mitochondrial isoform X2 [Patagioenas fasciata]|uniref:elongation factor Ts, mitochondrial isoform X2 n=1 Tax=Patagioenas fasciata TaxID=372321 RepID=UPI003A9A3B22
MKDPREQGHKGNQGQDTGVGDTVTGTLGTRTAGRGPPGPVYRTRGSSGATPGRSRLLPSQSHGAVALGVTPLTPRPIPGRSDVIVPRRRGGEGGGMRRAALGALSGAARAPPGRWFRAAPPVLAADKEALLELRRRTGLPFVLCRDALLRAGGDRQQVTCETDFVARNAEFQRVVEQAALGTMELCRAAPPPPDCGTRHLLREDELAQLRTGPGGDLLSDKVALAIGKLGENVRLRRAAWLRVPEADGHIGAYAHGWLPARAGPVAVGSVAMGTHGALVAWRVTAPRPPPAELEELGRLVAQHVVAMAPTALGTPGDVAQGEEEPRLLAQGFVRDPQRSVGDVLAQHGGLALRGFLRFRAGEGDDGDSGDSGDTWERGSA